MANKKFVLRWKDLPQIEIQPTRANSVEEVWERAIKGGVYPAGMTEAKGEEFLRKNAEVVESSESRASRS